VNNNAGTAALGTMVVNTGVAAGTLLAAHGTSIVNSGTTGGGMGTMTVTMDGAGGGTLVQNQPQSAGGGGGGSYHIAGLDLKGGQKPKTYLWIADGIMRLFGCFILIIIIIIYISSRNNVQRKKIADEWITAGAISCFDREVFVRLLVGHPAQSNRSEVVSSLHRRFGIAEAPERRDVDFAEVRHRRTTVKAAVQKNSICGRVKKERRGNEESEFENDRRNTAASTSGWAPWPLAGFLAAGTGESLQTLAQEAL
jgi:hypothetical protein